MLDYPYSEELMVNFVKEISVSFIDLIQRLRLTATLVFYNSDFVCEFVRIPSNVCWDLCCRYWSPSPSSPRLQHPAGHHGVGGGQQLAGDGALRGQHGRPLGIPTHHRGDGPAPGEALPHRLWGWPHQRHHGAGTYTVMHCTLYCNTNTQYLIVLYTVILRGGPHQRHPGAGTAILYTVILIQHILL